ncbi:methyltransferase domain-containing protein [uncultured Sphingomonas sp.]|uniref:class I SAM-dependent methyltransferase n=1 Tax=uncultured Sphingomonas sp. TaxID=158754 RepID=UPI0025CC670E|nr:methyltransferase domain-containing protein [uncultured Sphingomonas sp.]
MPRSTSLTRPALALAATLALSVGVHAAIAPKVDPAIARAVADTSRSEADRARDRYRHPAETLAFFGVTPAKKVVEYNPSGGWYSQILARVPANGGSYTALVTSAKAADGARQMLATKSLTGIVATVDPATGTSTVPANSQDVVLTFRNVHNLTMAGGQSAANVFKAWFTMLKPGGTLGIVDHRLPEQADTARERESGYLKVSTIRRLAENAGFKLAESSEVNANSKDDTNHPKGVWTLPPTYAAGDADRAKYATIGESDRMTLRFVKPR